MHRQSDEAAQDRTPPADPALVLADLLEAARERLAPELGDQAGPLREHLGAVQRRAAGATSWLATSEHYARLLNFSGVVPVTARFDVHDLMFLGQAREDLLRFAELGRRLSELHQPLDATGPGEAASPRCRSCMWRWPCPTLRLMAEILLAPSPRDSTPGHVVP